MAEPKLPATSANGWNKRALFIAAVCVLILFAAGAAYLIPRVDSVAPADRRAERGTKSKEAYRLYLQGSFAYEQRTGVEARKAVDLFDQAIKLDPGFAHAWAGKGRALRYAAAVEGRTSTTNMANHKL